MLSILDPAPDFKAFALDPQGVIQYATANNRKVGRSISELVRVLEALRTGDAVGAGWQPGQPTLGR